MCAFFFLFPFVLSPRGGGKEKKKKKVRKVRCASPLLLLHPDIAPNIKPRAAVVSNRSTHSSTVCRSLSTMCMFYGYVPIFSSFVAWVNVLVLLLLLLLFYYCIIIIIIIIIIITVCQVLYFF
ncbi:BEM_collapsed_G0034340.mRNA.1.CDS.1 [Saccharomyces cerevisiae]|nr:BEM_HP_G0160130.mRNA.1.CDS.1 [Saccharomyces cerevisiae]CAI5008618.1 BEM_HP_G0019110.mRNA.1.CDS.1 [Saccharomyces cerevisiae]CAI5199051.1 BEM_HP_G0096920.mRNA.1.CDS.1 [Saccharomyces cerevisiae]CAI6759669.1 BEM_HP_G0160130.mRNA.1.CDS.1 [Saccharomyces cerevisiae]CAI6925662.1 BEM_HP_G0019110.mRNA.1.CDS.1 [Saccharomyces cerevisiae]